MKQNNIIDIIIIIVYLVAVVFIGVWISRKRRSTSNDYFLAGKSLNWFIIGSALFASNISTVHLVGFAETGFTRGMLMGNFEWFSAFELLLLAFVFIPFYLKTKISTLPEFLEKRYDSRSRTVLAIISILVALFAHIGINFYSGAIVFQYVFGIDIVSSVVVIGIATGIYTIIGGLTSVVFMETIQTIILLLGCSIITILSIMHLPDVGIHSYSELKNAVGTEKLHMINFNKTANNFSFIDMVIGHLILGIWYFCTDQTIVQRALGAKSESDAKLGAIFAGFLKILPVFLMIVPGILAFALFKNDITDTRQTFAFMVNNLMPIGLKGLMMAALLAAVMNSVSAALNSCSTLVVFDIISRIKTELSDKRKIFIGRFTAMGVLLCAIIWSPFLGNLGEIFKLINDMFGVFAPSIVVVFLFGILSHKGTPSASFWTLITGSLFAISIFIIEKYVTINGTANFISSKNGLGINWLQQILCYFIVSSIIYITISIGGKTQTLSPEYKEMFKLEITMTNNKIKFLSILLVIVMLSLYVCFY